jgi:putative cofactor-binding repeat protein
MVAGCLVAALAVTVYDDVAHGGRYRAAAGKMVGHMMSVTWKR